MRIGGEIKIPAGELMAAVQEALDDGPHFLEMLVDRIVTRLEATGARVIYDF